MEVSKESKAENYLDMNEHVLFPGFQSGEFGFTLVVLRGMIVTSHYWWLDM